MNGRELWNEPTDFPMRDDVPDFMTSASLALMDSLDFLDFLGAIFYLKFQQWMQIIKNNENLEGADSPDLDVVDTASSSNILKTGEEQIFLHTFACAVIV